MPVIIICLSPGHDKPANEHRRPSAYILFVNYEETSIGNALKGNIVIGRRGEIMSYGGEAAY